MKNCKICGSINQDDAAKCAFCNSDFDPASVLPKEKQLPKGAKKKNRPMRRSVAILLMLAISYLLTQPIALSYGGSFFDSLPIVLVCWAAIFIILVAIYYFSRSRAIPDDYTTLYTDKQRTYTDDGQTSAALNAQGQAASSTFSDTLYDVCRRADYLTLPAYDAEMTCEAAALLLVGHSHGLDAPTARALLAALAARRMVVLCGSDDTDLDRAIGNVARLTGETPPTIKLNRACATPNDLYVAEGTAEAPKPSPFLCSVYAAHTHKKSICPLLLDAETPDKLNTAMDDIKPYLENGMIDGKVTVKGANRDYANITTDEVVALPANARLFLAYRPGRSNLPAGDLLEVCAFVNLKTAVSGAETTSETTGALSFDRLLRLCDDAEERYYLSEDNWKKIDELTEHLAGSCSFTLGNKLVTAMERFVGVYMAAGGTEQEALDAVLASLLLPAALTAPTLAKSEDTPALSHFLDACFGLENLPGCAETLKKFNAA